jgi:hypothetical protein
MIRSPRAIASYGTRFNWPAHASEMRELLGLRYGQKLPQHGLPKRAIQGITVWVEPAPPLTYRLNRYGEEYRVHFCNHRVKAQCPHCGWIGSAGRLHQHVCK